MDNLGITAQAIGEMLAPMVAMFVKEVAPAKDEMSKTKAYKAYGRTWIEKQIARGNLATRNKGGIILVSRAAIELLKKAETSSAEFLIKH